MTRSVHLLLVAARRCIPAALLLQALGVAAAPAFTFATYPLFLAPPVPPNVLIMFDNSESMDGYMAGMVVSGDDPNTRGNIARSVLRDVLASYPSAFNWGLGSFQTSGLGKYTIYAYYLGNATTMVYTNDCVAGISASNAGLRCIANPSPANGYGYITYGRSGDDADINDVLYANWGSGPFYGVGTSGVCYNVYGSRDASTGWANANFSSLYWGGACFTATDAGFVPQVALVPRQLWINRGWGYYGDITGAGVVNEPVLPYSVAHMSNLNALLGSETGSTSSPEIKNNAVATPLAGTLLTANNYFSKGLSSSQKSPVSQTCQRNFVMLATDGNPTGRTNGSMYDPSQWVSTYNASTGTWTYGQAQKDVFDQLTALRSITLSGSNLSTPSLAGRTYDVQTYIVGMGDTVANASSIAALNQMAALGGGYPTAFLGSDGTALKTAFQSIVGDIQSKVSAASSVALNSGSWTSTAALYQAKFSSADWSGNLVAYPVGKDGGLAATPSWETATQMKAQNWDTGRVVLTYKPSAAAGARGIPFRWPAVVASPTATELDTSQTTALNKNYLGTTDGNGAWRLKFLRGDTTKEARNCTGSCTPQFRNRGVTPLGDIVNSSPYYVGTPAASYYDDMESVSYRSFVTSHAAPTRPPMIYVGANDGMLHAIDATTGNEAFAYVPSPLYPSLTNLTSVNYSHQYYADGAPTAGDVFYAGAWHTLLVSGMRAGAKGLFALDVTNPATFSESNAAGIVRWEFQDPDLGYVFSQPVLMKTNNGRWSVIVANGYNAGAGSNYKATLFIIDAETGALVKKIAAGSGSSTDANGLSGAAVIDVDHDRIGDIVYAGDLNGSLWRFDLSSSSVSSWGVGNGGAPLFNAGRPIVGRPNVTLSPKGGFMVVFGTGSYMSTSDGSDTSTQAVYGLHDTLATGTVTLSQLLQQTIVAEVPGDDGVTYRLSTHAVGPAIDHALSADNAISLTNYYLNKRGWYLPLPGSGERAVADPLIRGGRAVITSLIPDTSSPCAYGGTGWVMEFDVNTGNRNDAGSFDTNGDGLITSADNVTYGGGRDVTSGRAINAVPAAPSVIELPSTDPKKKPGDPDPTRKACTEVKYQNKSDGGMAQAKEMCGTGGSARVMWRELQ